MFLNTQDVKLHLMAIQFDFFSFADSIVPICAAVLLRYYSIGSVSLKPVRSWSAGTA